MVKVSCRYDAWLCGSCRAKFAYMWTGTLTCIGTWCRANSAQQEQRNSTPWPKAQGLRPCGYGCLTTTKNYCTLCAYCTQAFCSQMWWRGCWRDGMRGCWRDVVGKRGDVMGEVNAKEIWWRAEEMQWGAEEIWWGGNSKEMWLRERYRDVMGGGGCSTDVGACDRWGLMFECCLRPCKV